MTSTPAMPAPADLAATLAGAAQQALRTQVIDIAGKEVERCDPTRGAAAGDREPCGGTP